MDTAANLWCLVPRRSKKNARDVMEYLILLQSSGDDAAVDTGDNDHLRTLLARDYRQWFTGDLVNCTVRFRMDWVVKVALRMKYSFLHSILATRFRPEQRLTIQELFAADLNLLTAAYNYLADGA